MHRDAADYDVVDVCMRQIWVAIQTQELQLMIYGIWNLINTLLLCRFDGTNQILHDNFSLGLKFHKSFLLFFRARQKDTSS